MTGWVAQPAAFAPVTRPTTSKTSGPSNLATSVVRPVVPAAPPSTPPAEPSGMNVVSPIDFAAAAMSAHDDRDAVTRGGHVIGVRPGVGEGRRLGLAHQARASASVSVIST